MTQKMRNFALISNLMFSASETKFASGKSDFSIFGPFWGEKPLSDPRLPRKIPGDTPQKSKSKKIEQYLKMFASASSIDFSWFRLLKISCTHF